MNPYTYLLENASLLAYQTSITLILSAWIFLSYRKFLTWSNTITASRDRWEHFLLPPKDITHEIVLFAVMLAANVFLTGLLFHLFA